MHGTDQFTQTATPAGLKGEMDQYVGIGIGIRFPGEPPSYCLSACCFHVSDLFSAPSALLHVALEQPSQVDRVTPRRESTSTQRDLTATVPEVRLCEPLLLRCRHY